jgi:Uma2 family endonuclease
MSAIVAGRRGRVPIVLGDAIIPDSVVDLESFRRWARSRTFPAHGWFSFLDGKLWVDQSMEQLFSHNQVKTEFTVVLGGLVKANDPGYFFSDRTLFSNPSACLATEPDGLFISWASLQSGHVRLIEAKKDGFIEIEGTPDMVLEVVSRYSEHKDTKVLRDLYWRAGVSEYWLVDGRGETPRFDILRHGAKSYSATKRQRGWLKSTVFGCWFMLSRVTDRLGHPKYRLAVRS